MEPSQTLVVDSKEHQMDESHPQIKIKDMADDSHKMIEVHELKEKFSTTIVLDVLPKQDCCKNILVIGEENDEPQTDIIKQEDGQRKREDAKVLDCFYCGFEDELSHMEDHYNVLRLSEPPFDDCEIGFECKQTKRTRSLSGHSCSACQFASRDADSLREHVFNCHTKAPFFLCPECNVSFKTKRSLSSHFLVHTKEKPFKCSLCAFTCKLKLYLRNHVRLVHSGYKPLRCSKCDFKCMRNFEMSKHELTHTKEKPYVCSICNFKSKSMQYLKKHMFTHKDSMPFHCAACDYQCITKHILKAHYISHHTNEKPFECSVCGLCFKRKASLRRHLVTHSEEKPFRCDLCDYACSRKDNLLSHVSIAHTDVKPFRCTRCDFACKLKTALKFHMKVHSLDRPFACERCNYRFVSEAKLRRHAVSHSFERKFSCPHCLFRGKTKTELKIHSNSTHGTKHVSPLLCPACEFSCKRRLTLQKHMEKQHLGSSAGLYERDTDNRRYEYNKHSSNLKVRKCSPVPERVQAILCCPNCNFQTPLKTQLDNHMCNCLLGSSKVLEPSNVHIHINSTDCPSEVAPQIKIEQEESSGNGSSSSNVVCGDTKVLKISCEDSKADLIIDEVPLEEFTVLKEEESSVSDGRSDVSHSKVLEYQCEHCSFSATTKYDLKCHLKVHAAGKGHPCPKCDARFISRTELKDHLSLTHTDYKPYECPECRKSFKTKSNLKQHITVHSEAKPHQCLVCDYRSKLVETLRRHSLTHSTEKPFQCGHCNYRCKLKEKLKRHLLTHSEERPFRCPHCNCNYTSKTKELLKKHAIVHLRAKERTKQTRKKEQPKII